METLKSWLHLDRRKPTKVLISGASPSLGRKSSSRNSRPKERKERVSRQPPALPSVGKPTIWHESQTCSKGEISVARGEGLPCINHTCQGCANPTTAGEHDDRVYCRGCLRKIDARASVAEERKRSWEGGCTVKEELDDMPTQLCGPRTRRDREVLKRAMRCIDAESVSSFASTKAVLECSRETITSLREEEMKSSVAGWKEFKFKKRCENAGSGHVVFEEDGNGVTIRTCSDDSAVLITLTDEDHRHEGREEAVFSAAQIGSPTGTCIGYWPTPYLRSESLNCREDPAPVTFKATHFAHPTSIAEDTWLAHRKEVDLRVNVEDSTLRVPELPRIRACADLPDMLQEAMGTPMPCSRNGLGIRVPNNTPEELELSSTTTHPTSMPWRTLAHDDEISGLELSSPAHVNLYREGSSTGNWRDLLDHPSVSRSWSSSSPPASLLIERARESFDSEFFCVPKSLEDSTYCKDLIGILSKQEQKGKQRGSHELHPTYSEYPRPNNRRQRHDSLISDTSTAPEHIHYIEYKAKCLSRTLSYPTPKPNSPAPPKTSTNLLTSASSTSPTSPTVKVQAWAGLNETPSTPSPPPLMFNSHYRDHINHPHPHTSRTPSPVLTPYPSLASSATDLEFGFRPTLEGVDLARAGEVMPSQSHISSVTPYPREQSPSSARPRSESLHLSAVMPERKDSSGTGRALAIRSTESQSEVLGESTYEDRESLERGSRRNREEDDGNGSRVETSVSRESRREQDNHQDTSTSQESFGYHSDSEECLRQGILKRGGGRQHKESWLKKVVDIYEDCRESRRIKRERKRIQQRMQYAKVDPGDLKSLRVGSPVIACCRCDKVAKVSRRKKMQSSRRR